MALELTLTPEYYAKWWKEDEEEGKKKDKTKEKTEAKELALDAVLIDPT